MARDSGLTLEYTTAAPSGRWVSWQVLLPAFTVVAMVVAVARAFFPGWGTPLWLDETYTATIATQPDFAHFIDWCLHELSGPVYYSIVWVWAHLFGSGAGSLRMPSLICAVAMPVLILLKGHPSRDVRLLWAVLLTLWMPGVTFPSEARPYALLMLLATGQAVLFYRLIATGGRHKAMAWSAVSAIMILTHYHTIPVTAVQGLIYLGLRRGEIGKTWPAALAFVPVALWMVVHVPFVLSFVQPGVAWYPLLTLSQSWKIPFILMGGNPATGALFAVAVPALFMAAYRGINGKETSPYTTADLATAGASIFATSMIILIAYFKPVFLLRYFVPYVPGLMLGLALWLNAKSPKYPFLPAVVVATVILFGAAELGDRIRHPEQDIRNRFSWDKASGWLQQQGMQRLIFFWDNSTASISTSARTGEVAGYFLRRDGWKGSVIVPPIAGKAVDPNRELPAIANRAGDGIIWLYDENFGGSLALKHRPLLARKNSLYRCRNFGAQAIKIITCIKR